MGPRRGLIAAILIAAVVVLAFLVLDRAVRNPPRRANEARSLDVDQALGATLEPLDRETAEDLGLPPNTRGLVVTSLCARGPADLAGVRTGDVIERAGALPLRSLGDVGAAIGQPPHELRLTLNRHGHYAIVRVRPQSAKSGDGAE